MENKEYIGLLSPTLIQKLCGKMCECYGIGIHKGEVWKAQKLLRVEITENGVFAIMNEDFEIEVNLSDYNLIPVKEG